MVEKLIGTQLGGYEVRALLGSGGMASVYKGYDPALDREVAIKVISTAGRSTDFVARFQREARVAARLRHPNIVQIYHFGAQNDSVYMVQELLPGPTLERRMRAAGRKRLAAERVLAVVEQLAGALDFAHGQGVIHRDVKPSNALYNAHGQLALTDFGIAREITNPTQTTTGPGVVMGTPGYLAPEQAISSVALTPACDVYALGVLLFELLTGRLPFEADTPMGVILKHLYDEPPRPGSLRADLPAALDAVVLRALRKEPGERYPSAGALAQALQANWPSSPPLSAKSASPRPTKAVTPPAPARPKTDSASAAKVTPVPKAAVAGAPAAKREIPASRASTRAAAATNPIASRTTPKPSDERKPTTPKPKTAAPTVAAPPQQRMGRLRVGLFTAAVVGALILFGRDPNALDSAWQTIRSLLGF